MSITYHLVKSNGITINYAKAGSGNELILFLHGFPEFSYMWRKQLKYFASDFTAIAPDLRGYGESDKPKSVESYSI